MKRLFAALKHPNQTPQHVRGLAGFTLVEMTVVLGVIAAVMGTAVAMFTASLEGKAAAGTLTKMRTLQQALMDYRLAYNRLPCPANSVSYAAIDANFGIEAVSTSNCMGGLPTADTADSTAAVGMVPVRTLGLPDDMAFDMWGRRIRYAVVPAFTGANAFDGIAIDDNTTRITVNNNNNGEALTTTAGFVLVSYGPNGHGARGGMGTATGTTTYISAGMTNTSELLNCKCTTSGILDGAVDLDTFVQGDPKPDPTNATNNFDDIVVFSSRVQIRDTGE